MSYFGVDAAKTRESQDMIYPRISSDAEVMMGKPCIRGTRITVELILRKLGHGSTIEELLASYPSITKDDVLAAHAFAADYVSSIRAFAIA